MSAPVYEFDDEFQSKVSALVLRDPVFNTRTEGLIEPSYFANEAESLLVLLALNHWKTYKTTPSISSWGRILSDARAKKIIRDDMKDEVVDTFKRLLKEDLSDRDFVIDEVAGFAKHQAIIASMERAIKLLDKRDFAAIEKDLTTAFRVAANDGAVGHDLLGDIEARTERRKDIAAGVKVPSITTGFPDLDKRLANGGFVRKELSVLLGPAKKGKSFGLMNFAVNAQLAGFNVLYVTLENSVEVTTDRIDAYISEIATDELLKHIIDVETKVRARLAKAGVMKIHEYPTGTFSPNDLRRVIEHYRATGLVFDEIVVDYWDIMRPDVIYRDDSIRESASIGMGLRAISKEENAAVVTAVQSNRDGFKAFTAKAEHAAEDFNKVRLADVMISINATEEEREVNQARLYMAAVRNAKGDYTINIEQDLSRAAFISKVLGKATI